MNLGDVEVAFPVGDTVGGVEAAGNGHYLDSRGGGDHGVNLTCSLRAHEDHPIAAQSQGTGAGYLGVYADFESGWQFDLVQRQSLGPTHGRKNA